MNVDSEDNNVPFHLQCRPMSGSDIYLYDINPQYTICMVKNLLTDRLGLREDQLRLLFNDNVLEDNRSLEFYNVNNFLLSCLWNVLVVEQELDVLLV